MTYKPKKTYRLSTPLRFLLGSAAIGIVFFLAVFLVPLPLPYWIRAVCILQIGLTILLLVYLCRLIWSVLRK
jgi:hypothetical protein